MISLAKAVKHGARFDIGGLALVSLVEPEPDMYPERGVGPAFADDCIMGAVGVGL